MEEVCSICGDSLKKHYCQKLKCNHGFHYECLMKSFKGMKNTDCPYCRSKNNKLPIVNGLKKIDYYIHDVNNINEHENITCKTILKSGSRKGLECGGNCKLGFFTCTRHTKIN
jgi:hypothetical protein